jgi:flavin-binding protein dodecin
MADHVYRLIELVGSSETSHEEAIRNALTRANATLRNLRWFEVVQLRGEIEDGRVHHYQATIKAGFRVEDPG